MKLHRLWAAVAGCGVALVLVACNDQQLVPHTEVGTGGIHGRVCGPNGMNWLAEARVSVPIQDDSGNVIMEPETLTDLDGYFTLMDVPAGTWMLKVEKNSFSTEIEVTVVEGEVYEIPEPACIDPYSANVAVVTGLYDKVEDVLSRVGLTNVTMYDGTGSGGGPSAQTLLNDLGLMAQYDIIFFNCGMVENGLINNPDVMNNVRMFVESGGSLYASDWAYDYVEIAWPTAVEFYLDDNTPNDAAWGMDGPITASVQDSDLSSFLGTGNVTLNYDLGQWVVTEGAGGGTRVLVTGSATALNPYTFQFDTISNAPLMVMFEAGDGKVMYTTFHNEAQTTADMDVILEYMVFEL